MAQKFSPREPGIFKQEDADIWGVEVDRIERTTGSRNPKVVLEDATNIHSPLHGYYNWDDSQVAHAYRLGRTGMFMRQYTVEYEDEDGEIRQVLDTSFIEYEDEEGNTQETYEATVSVLDDETKSLAHLRRAVKHVRGFRLDLAVHPEAKSLVRALDALCRKLSMAVG